MRVGGGRPGGASGKPGGREVGTAGVLSTLSVERGRAGLGGTS
jgi:hypothetical protein